jgi:hypothetical protein
MRDNSSASPTSGMRFRKVATVRVGRDRWCKRSPGGWQERALRAGELSCALNRVAKQHVAEGKSTAGSIS